MNGLKISKRKVTITALLILFIVLLGTVLTWGASSSDIDRRPETDATDYESQAYIHDSGNLASQLGGLNQYISLTEDMHVFATKSFPVYTEDTKRIVGFKPSKASVKAAYVVSLSGRFGASKDKIEIKVTLLKNDRIKTSITNTRTGKNYDSELPSNTKTNQFLATLPIEENDYRIDYQRTVNGGGVTITYYIRDAALTKASNQKIIDAIGEEAAKNLSITATFPSPSFEQ
ncbi:MAG: hypothetical protein WAQ57_00875 [Candidatus Saccharimonadales bacterium]